MTAEEKLKERVAEFFNLSTSKDVFVNRDGCVRLSADDIDLIANLVVERQSLKLDKILTGISCMIGEEVV